MLYDFNRGRLARFTELCPIPSIPHGQKIIYTLSYPNFFQFRNKYIVAVPLSITGFGPLVFGWSAPKMMTLHYIINWYSLQPGEL